MKVMRLKKKVLLVLLASFFVVAATHKAFSVSRIDEPMIDTSLALPSFSLTQALASHGPGQQLSFGDIGTIEATFDPIDSPDKNRASVQRETPDWIQKKGDGTKKKSRSSRKELTITKHKILNGESLGRISKKYRVSVATLMSFNGLSRSVIQPGKVLNVPNMDGVQVKLRRGETPWDLARSYKVKLSDILEVNNVRDAKYLKAGQKLFLPGAKKMLPRSRRRVSAKSKKRTFFPIPGGRISSSFGFRRHPISKRYRFHNGLDIAARRGTKIIAFRAGTVIFSGRNGGYGHCVYIRHKSGLVTRYAHNKRNLVKRGAKVSAGQKIALVGSSGKSTGPHLHFEVLKNGRRQNPRKYF
ncbi:MAG: M23 family metallopeptidase [Candidatus Lindowbacteria bacterium]|nr:M23 family metallopeptidase [Candidatus Lindowbacteria bacterium]